MVDVLPSETVKDQAEDSIYTMDSRLKKVIWEGVVNLGFKVDNDAWCSGKFVYLNGYTALKRILWHKHDYTVECKIISSTTGRPLFQCSLKENADILDNVTATNPTTAVKNILNTKSIKLNFKNGNSFFGLDRKDVQDMISKCIVVRYNSDQSFLGAVTEINDQRQASWFGVVSFGEIKLLDKLNVSFGGKSFRLQHGYECLQNILLPNNSEVILHCKIEVDNNNNVVYKCFTVEDPIIDCEDKQPTPPVKRALNLLGVISKKKWSGYEFFGFMRSDVLKVLTSRINEVNEATSSKLTKKGIKP